MKQDWQYKDTESFCPYAVPSGSCGTAGGAGLYSNYRRKQNRRII